MYFNINYSMAAASVSISPPIIDEKYNQLSRQIMASYSRKEGPSSGVVTRSISTPIACKTSALIYVIIYMLILNGIIHPITYLSYTGNTGMISDIIQSVKSDFVFDELINNNKIGNPALQLMFDVSNRAYLHSKNVFFMVLLNVSDIGKEFDSRYNIGNISHYFVIVQRDGTFYLISSYGSSVCSPQQEVELDLTEWAKFVHDFTNPHEEVKRVNENLQLQLQKYFLPPSKTTLFPRGEDEKDYKGDVSAAIQDDINLYIEYEHQIVCIDNIFELLLPFIPKVRTPKKGGKSKKKYLKLRKKSKKNILLYYENIQKTVIKK